MSYPSHLIKVNNRFYSKVKVPVDLQNHFPCTFIKKSLRTPDLREAKTMLAAMEYNTHRSFTLLRSGMLPADTVRLVASPCICKLICWGTNLLYYISRRYIINNINILCYFCNCESRVFYLKVRLAV